MPATFVPQGRGPRVAIGGESHAAGAGSLNVPVARNSREPLAWAQVLSGGGFQYVWNFGLGSSSIASAMTRLQGALDQLPDAVVLLSGTYDTNPTQGVSFASYQASIAEFVERCHEAGAVPIVGTVFPTITAGETRQNVERANAWLRTWCPANGAQLLNTFDPLVDPATGAIKASLADTSGVHANEAGNAILGAQLLTILRNVLPAWSPPLATFQTADAANIASNGLFLTDTDGVGAPDGYALSNMTGAKVAAGAEAKGNWFEITSTNDSTATALQDSLPDTKWDPGDRIVFCGRFFHEAGTSTKTLGLQLNCFGGTPNSIRPLNSWAGNVSKSDGGVFCVETTIPPGTTQLNIVAIHNAGTLGTGLKSGFAQMTIVNLTRLGIA